jgi:hypothetical protein
MKITDLVQSKDGSLSLTKLAASTAHLNLAVAFAWITYTRGFVGELWMVYGAFAVGHATADKVMATVSAFKNKQLDGKTP